MTVEPAATTGETAMETRFPHLFRPGRIGALEVKNRIFMAPMATGFCESEVAIRSGKSTGT